MNVISKFLQGGGSYFSSDVITLAVLFSIFFVGTLYFGKRNIISIVLAFYPTQFFYSKIPFMDSLLVLKGDNLLTLNKIIIFVIIWVIFTILFGRYVFHDSGYGSAHYLRMAGYAMAGVVVVLVFSYSVVSLDGYHNFSQSIDVLFSSPMKVFWWNFAPLALLAVL